MPSKVIILATALVSAVAVSGCGGGGAPAADPDKPRGIFISSNDCADGGFLDFDACSDAIAKAIETHDESMTTYASERACEATEGEGKCERTFEDKFRAKLLAYLVTGGEEPEAAALYPPKKGQNGFRDALGTTYEEKDFTIQFSRSSVATFKKYASKVGGIRR